MEHKRGVSDIGTVALAPDASHDKFLLPAKGFLKGVYLDIIVYAGWTKKMSLDITTKVEEQKSVIILINVLLHSKSMHSVNSVDLFEAFFSGMRKRI